MLVKIWQEFFFCVCIKINMYLLTWGIAKNIHPEKKRTKITDTELNNLETQQMHRLQQLCVP